LLKRRQPNIWALNSAQGPKGESRLKETSRGGGKRRGARVWKEGLRGRVGNLNSNGVVGRKKKGSENLRREKKKKGGKTKRGKVYLKKRKTGYDLKSSQKKT